MNDFILCLFWIRPVCSENDIVIFNYDFLSSFIDDIISVFIWSCPSPKNVTCAFWFSFYCESCTITILLCFWNAGYIIKATNVGDGVEITFVINLNACRIVFQDFFLLKWFCSEAGSNFCLCCCEIWNLSFDCFGFICVVIIINILEFMDYRIVSSFIFYNDWFKKDG